MARRKAYTPEEIVAKLRQVEVLVGQGRSVAEAGRSIGGTEPSYYRWRAGGGGVEGGEGAVAEAVRSIGVTEPSYYRWRSEYGGLKVDQVKRLKEPERENARWASPLGVEEGDQSVMRLHAWRSPPCWRAPQPGCGSRRPSA